MMVQVTNLVNNGRYSGATTASLVILSIPANFYGYKYRCVLNGTDFTMPITIKAVTKWTGDISTDWLDPLNWSCSVIPDAYTDVIIDSNSGRYPVLNTDAIIRSIRLSPGATVLLNTPGNLKINN